MQNEPPRTHSWLNYGPAIALALALVVYANTLGLKATLDDIYIVERNPLAQSLTEIGRIFSTSYWGFEERLPDTSLYRPFTILTFALERTIFGEALWVSHATNVLLHAAASALLCATVRRWSGDARLACAAAVLFALHPVHTEAVAGLVGRAEILAALGILGTLYAWDRARTGGWMWIAIATAACVVGAASKEIGVTAPAVVLAAEIVLPAKRWLLRGERRAFVALALLVLVLTVFLVAHAAVTTPNRELMGLIGLPASERIPTALALLVEYGRLAFFPFVLSADYTLLDLPLVHSLSNPRALGGSAIVVALAAGAWFARRRAPAVTWGVLATAITFAPVSNILFGVGIVVAERALYSPSIGLCVAVAGLLSKAWGRDTFSRAATVVFWLVVVAFAARTWTRNPAWRDNETLGLATIAVFPRSHIAHDILAQYYAEREDWQAAAPHVHASLATEECKDMRFIEGEIAVRAGRLDDAIQRYRMVIAADPGHQAAYNQLGLALSDLGRHDEAIAVFSEMQRAFPTQPTAWLNLVFLHSQRADLARALSVALDAVARFPDSAEVLRTAGAVHAALGNTEAAQDFARRAEAATVR